MLALFSLILVIVGCANWLCIGLLQFDFVAGLFGSQSNIFSRIVYVIVGIAAIILTVNIIKNKGKIGFNFKKLKFKKEPQPAMQMESGQDYSKSHNFQANQQHNQMSHNQQYSHQQPQYHSSHDMKSISQQLSAKHDEHKNSKQ